MGKSRLLIPAFLLALVVSAGVAACGGGESDEEKITSVIEKAATSSDPAVCEETQTQSFMEQTSYEEGKQAALENCEEEAKETASNAESVDVSEIEFEGEFATATAAFNGGSLDGQAMVLSLVAKEGDWKIDEAVEFAGFDREKMIAQFEKSFAEQEALEPAVIECTIEGAEEMSDSELEGLLLESPVPLVEVAEECSE